MEHTEAKQAMKELTMMLIYLSRFCANGKSSRKPNTSMPGKVTILMC